MAVNVRFIENKLFFEFGRVGAKNGQMVKRKN